MAVRRGKFRAFLKSAPHSVKYDLEHSVTNSLDDEISVEISVGPRGKHVFVNKSKSAVKQFS